MAKKKIIHAPKSCGGTMEVLYNKNNIPYLQCDRCSHKINDWVAWEEQYKDIWQDQENWKAKKNHLTCILGYFCARYKDYYGIDYTLSLNEKGLFRGSEINVLRRLYVMLENDPWKVKEYIDFIFNRKVQKRKKRITNLSYLVVQDFVQEFKLHVEQAKFVTRSTPLPSAMIAWVKKFAPEVENSVVLNDYGDLHLLLSHHKNGHFKNNDSVNKFVKKLQERKYINTDLNIYNWRSS